MNKNSSSQSGLFNPVLFALCSAGVFLAVLSFAAIPSAGNAKTSVSMSLAAGAAGSWAIVASANSSVAQDNFLRSVTCTSASDCWAVGDYSYYSGSVHQTLAQTLIGHWNGISWTIVTSPNANPALPNNVLRSVTCASASDCWAVGSYVSAKADVQVETLIEHWDGTSWTIVATPNASLINILSGVTCTSGSDCWAGGSYASSGAPYQTLIEHWNGTLWAVVPSANFSTTTDNSLSSMTCVSASDCWAVGSYRIYDPVNAVFHDQPLVERWDGTSWAVVPSSNPATDVNFLSSVTCASANECWAVGSYSSGSASRQTLIERWDGTLWTIVSSPNPATNDNVLYSVTCASANECWAVGEYLSANVYQTLVEQWDGMSWAIVSSPNTSATQANYLSGVTCASASQCWAVGDFYNSSAYQTLIEEYAPTIPPLTSVVSRLTHGSAGTFDINLPITGPRGVECRSSASLGAGNYQVVFTFVNNVTNCGTAGTVGGSVSHGPNLNQCTENLIGVLNAQYTTVTLNNVLDSLGNTGNVSATMGVLVGDVNANGVATNADVSLVKAQVAAGGNVDPAGSNFRTDVNANGVITNADVSLTKAQVAAGAQLPTPP